MRGKAPSRAPPEDKAKVAALKVIVGPASFRATDGQLARLIQRCGDDVGIAADALTMIPRSKWLERMLGE